MPPARTPGAGTAPPTPFYIEDYGNKFDPPGLRADDDRRAIDRRGEPHRLFAKRTNTKFLSAALGFSAGVMVYISFMELMPEALGMLGQQMSPRMAHICMLAAFFAGTSFIALIDFLIPEDENPHEIHRVEELSDTRRLQRTGVLMALAIGIHNFPEGLPPSPRHWATSTSPSP